MHNLTKNIVDKFNSFWTPQTLSSAEVLFSRFVAGEDLDSLADDYGVAASAAESAIRFFVLKNRRNKSVIEFYDDWQRKRFEK